MNNILKMASCLMVFAVTFSFVACKSEPKKSASEQQSINSSSSSNVSTSKIHDEKQNELKKYLELAQKYDKKPGKENEIEALKWWTKAAELGDAGAQYTVGLSYFTGIGAEQNLKTAQSWFLKSAQQGHIDAQYRAGLIYAESLNNDNKAFECYYKAAQQGHKDAQLQLAHCYANGKGVKKDAKEAFTWYKKSAEQGDPFAQMYLAGCYYKGLGTTKDINKAKEWYEKAAKHEDTAELVKIELEEIKNGN